MKRSKRKGTSPIFEIEFKDCNIKEIVYSIIIMFSVFSWDNTFKNPYEDKQLGEMLDKVQLHIEKIYIGGE